MTGVCAIRHRHHEGLHITLNPKPLINAYSPKILNPHPDRSKVGQHVYFDVELNNKGHPQVICGIGGEIGR